MTYYELLRYVYTGIASPDMSYYDRMRGDALRKTMKKKRGAGDAGSGSADDCNDDARGTAEDPAGHRSSPEE